MDWVSFGLGAGALWFLQRVYMAGRSHGVVSDGVDQLAQRKLHVVIRQAQRDPRADISKALGRSEWN